MESLGIFCKVSLHVCHFVNVLAILSGKNLEGVHATFKMKAGFKVTPLRLTSTAVRSLSRKP